MFFKVTTLLCYRLKKSFPNPCDLCLQKNNAKWLKKIVFFFQDVEDLNQILIPGKNMYLFSPLKLFFTNSHFLNHNQK